MGTAHVFIVLKKIPRKAHCGADVVNKLEATHVWCQWGHPQIFGGGRTDDITE